MKIDNRKLISNTGWSYYPNGEFTQWGNPGYNTRRDFVRSVFEAWNGRSYVEWRSGDRVYSEEEIKEIIKSVKTSRKAIFKRNPYLK